MSHPRNVKERLKSAAGLPDGIRLYMFGSSLEGTADSDIDLLFVYDSNKIHPIEIYHQLERFFSEVQSLVGRPVHPVVLSVLEEEQIQFAKNEGCVPIV